MMDLTRRSRALSAGYSGSRCGGIVFRYGVVPAGAGAAPETCAWPTTRSSRCLARSAPSCSTTASSASSHSRVSWGSTSVRCIPSSLDGTSQTGLYPPDHGYVPRASLFGGHDGDGAPAPALSELHDPGPAGVDRVVGADAGTIAGPEAGPALAHDDLAAGDDLTREHLDAEALGVGVAAVAAGAEALLMRHRSPSPSPSSWRGTRAWPHRRSTSPGCG